MDDKALFTILRCAEQTDGQVGRSGLLKILQGRDSRKLSKLKLDHLEEYGSLSFMRREAVLEHMDYLLERGCLAVSALFFPMLDITDVGRNRIKRLIQHDVLPDKPVTHMKDREIGATHVCDETEFWYLFPQDVGKAQHEVIIVSPFVNSRKAETFMKDFEQLTGRGTKVRVYARPLVAQERREAAILDTWEGMGVEVVYREGIHHKAAIIDQVIAWEGSLNILQHWKSKEHMTRHEDPEYIKQLMDVLEIK
jgi:superfamily II DNA helicase RecQ